MEEGADQIILGIGGSSTVDGGAGCLQALGVRFQDCAGQAMVDPLTGGVLSRIAAVEGTSFLPVVRIACDVTNPLLGPEGAAAVFGPQKGADPDGIRMLECGLEHLADLIDPGGLRDRPGAGAAGGLGFGLAAIIGATLEPGFPLVAEALGLRERVANADLCITGEGRLDAQSTKGKATAGVASLARELGVRVACIPGQVTDDAPRELFHQVNPLVGPGVRVEEALQHPEALLVRRSKEVVADLLH